MELSSLKNLLISELAFSRATFQAYVDELLLLSSIYNSRKSFTWLWISVIGGTGTGKSTIFNSLCHKPITMTGVKRPRTRGPVGAFPKGTTITHVNFMKTTVAPIDSSLVEGEPDTFTITEHNLPFPWALVDTPDIDSYETKHHRMAEAIYLMTDFIIFTMSQEKYADEKLNIFLKRVSDDDKEAIIIVNKVAGSSEHHDFMEVFATETNVGISSRPVFFLPFTKPVEHRISHVKEWKNLERLIEQKLTDKSSKQLKLREDEKIRKKLQDRYTMLIRLLKEEQKAQHEIEERINTVTERVISDLLGGCVADVISSSKSILSPEIKKIYNRYDFLFKIRTWLAETISTIFGSSTVKVEGDVEKERTLREIEKNLDHSALFNALDTLVKETLQMIPYNENRAVSMAVRKPELMVSKEEAREIIFENIRHLLGWLEGELSSILKGLPKSKEVAIYSSFLLWGTLIVGLDVALGGGISLMKVALDSVLAPILSRTTVDWFARREIYRITEELADRYRNILHSVILIQKERFLECLRSFKVDDRLIRDLENDVAIIT